MTASAKAFILHWGEMGTRWGVNRTVAQVHALLYLSSEPLSAEAIAENLGIARSNVSTSLRELQNWDLIHTVHDLGDRRVHYSTSHDVWTLFLTVIEQRVEREILPTMAMLRSCLAQAETERPARRDVTGRIAAMEAFLTEVHSWYVELKKLPPASLRAIVRSGAAITKLLPARSAEPARPERKSR